MLTYVNMADVSDCREFPVPTDLENWYVVEVPDGTNLYGKRFNPATRAFEDDDGSALEEIIAKRKEAYASESDPLHLEWQYELAQGSDEADAAKQDWLDKVTEIKERYPLPA